jgi:NAD(P)-dependent dehydrogenase (short-subunit alcohol dehydrogenase family)
MHPAIAPGRVAVITGAAGGIGLATAQRLAALGMRICIADLDEAALEAAAATMLNTDLLTVPTDVSHRTDIESLHEKALSRFGEVAVLMNNAGRSGPGNLDAGPEAWARILDTNLWGVIHGLQVFTPGMVAQGTPCAIINTGSKQGITTPPGNTAYNVSKAALKVTTEALAHDLREAGSAVTAHLLVPGFTFTGITRQRMTAKPDAAWEPSQVTEFLLAGLAAGDFYIICPDNDVTREMDEKRMQWAAEDVIRNRPALSRWHPDYKDEFAKFMAQ